MRDVFSTAAIVVVLGVIVPLSCVAARAGQYWPPGEGPMPGGTRYIGWNWDVEKCKAWHGEPDPPVSRVPLVFALPEADMGLVRSAVENRAEVSSRTGDFTNADVTPIIMQVLGETR